jgi:hypothetical protein
LGALDWAIDMGQSAEIIRLKEVCEKQQEEIDELKKNVEMLSKWVLHLKEKECPNIQYNV